MKRHPTSGVTPGLFSLGEGITKFVRSKAYGRYARAHADPATQKNIRKSARQSAIMRKKPVTLATKPFDHREGDS